MQVNPFKLNEAAQLEESALPPIRVSHADNENLISIFQPGFARDEGTRTLVQNFLSEYFNLYDGEETKTRENLISAYDDNVGFQRALHLAHCLIRHVDS